MNYTKATLRRFQKKIFDWWEGNKRDLPWRKTHDPYRIMVSEIMLQQTQVARGLLKYQEFITRFPSLESLAGASPAEVIRVWKGMGYNRRAVYLHGAARKIVTDYHGIFPQDERALLQLPGLGKYTTRAILVFAYKKDVAMVDTNIRQIITHFFFHDVPQSEKMIQEVADALIPQGKAWEWHQALMDYGALALDRKKNKRKKKQTPFKETNRYFRGRILDLLREGDKQEDEVYAVLRQTYKKDNAAAAALLQGLVKDKLISWSKTGIMSLPE